MINYYKTAAQASSKIGFHSALIVLKKYCESKNRILDIGCGEGSRLNTLLPQGKRGWGIDISPKAISIAKKKYPIHFFSVANAETIPFSNNYFDLTYSAFAIEHTQNPKQIISEMFRVTKSGGNIIILCPNYGAPNRRSPVSKENPYKKLINGFLNDYKFSTALNWKFVTPKNSYNQIDDDTVVEPYLHSLLIYLSAQHINILHSSSVWDQEKKSTNPRKLVIKLLGKIGIFPFKYWGPQLFIVAQK
jgi:ubiquinone/menaquinone biosynthesis C-methylase UbiE